MDWVARLLSLHPAVVVADPSRRLGPLGGGRRVIPKEEQERAGEVDPMLLADWDVGRWKRYFTPKAGKLFRMDASHALEVVTSHYGDDEWNGECEPGPE